MTTIQRRFLYSSFIFFFVAVCPLVLLYGTGYRFDLRHRRAFRIGLLALDITPAPDTLLIDGGARPFSNETTLRVGGLAPGQHHVRLEKSGYLPWKQDITIESGKATTIENIQLFRLGVPLVVSRNVENVLPSPDGKTLALIHAMPPTLTLADTNERPKEVIFADASPAFVRWSPDSKALLVIGKNGNSFIRNQETGKKESLPDPNVPVTDAAWHPKEADILYLLRNSVLFRWDRHTRTAEPLASGVQTFQPVEHEVLLVQKIADEQQLVVLHRNNSTTVLTRFPAAATLQLLPGPAEMVTLLDHEQERLLLFRRMSPTVTQSFPNVQQAAWTANDRTLLLQNSYELSRFDAAQMENPGETTLLLRSGTPIITARPLGTSTRFILLQQSNGLRLLDTAESTSLQSYVLFSGPLLTAVQTDSLLYLVTEKGLLVRLQL